MASDPGESRARPRVFGRRPAKPLVEVRTDPEDEVEEKRLSPWEVHGWAWSIGAHALLLLILGLWYFAPPSSKVKTFDTRIAGTELGSEEGMNTLGGLDTPLPPPEPTPPGADTSFSALKSSDITPDPMAGFAGKQDNPGAGQGDGFGLAKFGNGGEDVRGVVVKVGDPQFTLLWDTRVDLDLHVIEPGGKEIFWNDKKGRHGGELDVDNTEGFGPENIYWLTERPDGSRDLGPGPPGEYKWFVHYYGGNGGVPQSTRWKVRIKHEGKVEIFSGNLRVPNGRSKVSTLTVAPPSAADFSR